jgi:hypothetical protein
MVEICGILVDNNTASEKYEAGKRIRGAKAWDWLAMLNREVEEAFLIQTGIMQI